MNNTNLESQRNYYDSISKNYDELYQFEQEKKIIDIRSFLKNNNFFDLIINNSQNKNCLDIGVGTGVSSLWLKDYNFKIYGFDVSKNMIKKAKEKNPEGIYDVKSAEEIDFSLFKENNFDLTIILSAFQNFTKQSEILNNIFKVSKNIIISEPSRIIKKSLDKEISLFKKKYESELNENKIKIFHFDAGVDHVYLIQKIF